MESIKGTARMTAVAKLPEKWREHAAQIGAHTTAPHGLTWDHGARDALNRCADELEATLSPAELGGVDAEVVCNVFGEPFVKFSDGSKLRDHIGAKLYTTPRAAEAVSEEVWRVIDDAAKLASGESFGHACDAVDWIREALAALTPPSAKGE